MELGIEFISVFGLPPVQFVELAADLGCRHISTGLWPTDFNPHQYPKFSLREDTVLRREMVAVMRDRGVSVSLGEGFAIFENGNVRNAYAADLDIMRELGVRRINAVSLDPDRQRTFDQLAVLVEMAAMREMETVVEFVPIFTIADLPTAMAALRHVNRPDCKLLIDTMHFCRSGARVDDLLGVSPQAIGYVQLCDVPIKPSIADYIEEAMYERLIPNDGQLPLMQILSAVPESCVVGLEVPMRGKAMAGLGPRERLSPGVAAARALIDQMPTSRGGH